MKFERIDASTIRCIINEKDMEQYHVELEDFLTNSEKLHEFLHKMVREAKKVVDYKPPTGMLSMHITMGDNHQLSIRLSEADYSSEELFDTMKAQISNMTRENQLKMYELLQGATGEKPEEPKEEITAAEPVNIRIYEFSCLEHVIAFCHTISNRWQVHTELYKNENLYYLCIGRGNASMANFARVSLRADEFGRYISNSSARLAYIQEQYECIFAQKTIMKLNKIKPANYSES